MFPMVDGEVGEKDVDPRRNISSGNLFLWGSLKRTSWHCVYNWNYWSGAACCCFGEDGKELVVLAKRMRKQGIRQSILS